MIHGRLTRVKEVSAEARREKKREIAQPRIGCKFIRSWFFIFILFSVYKCAINGFLARTGIALQNQEPKRRQEATRRRSTVLSEIDFQRAGDVFWWWRRPLPLLCGTEIDYSGGSAKKRAASLISSIRRCAVKVVRRFHVRGTYWHAGALRKMRFYLTILWKILALSDY